VLQESILDKIQRLIDPILRDLDMELVDIEFKRGGKGWILRIFIDKEGGVTLDDCADVSREVGSVLDVEDVIDASYQLEVSSPGIERPLKKLQDYERFAGQMVKVKTFEKLDPDNRGQERKTFVGKLLGLDAGRVKILQMDKKGGVVELSLDQIAKANLKYDF
jgi:ribosome maturation factor RimP